jgi:hypothetical protein
MRPRTAVLAAVVALAVLAAWTVVARFALVRHTRERAAHEDRGTPVLALDPARAIELRLASSGREVRLVREGERWRFAVPGDVFADPRAVGALLDRLAALSRRGTSAGAGLGTKRLGPYGLDAPRRRFSVALDDGRVETLAIGLTTDQQGITFVMPTSGDVAIVSADAYADLERAGDQVGSGGMVPAGPAPAPTVPAPSRPAVGG